MDWDVAVDIGSCFGDRIHRFGEGEGSRVKVEFKDASQVSGLGSWLGDGDND